MTGFGPISDRLISPKLSFRRILQCRFSPRPRMGNDDPAAAGREGPLSGLSISPNSEFDGVYEAVAYISGSTYSTRSSCARSAIAASVIPVLVLREKYVEAGKIRHEHLFFLEDARPISDPEITRWRWSESITALNIRRRGPYHARHSSVTWQLMLGKNLLWVAKQHGHSVEVMLRMYAAWLEGATESDIHAIKQAMERRPAARVAIPDERAAISAVNAGTNLARLIVIRPPESPEFGSSLAVGKVPSDSSLRIDSQKKWRRGWDSNPRAGITRPSDFESAPL
jgi:hypothetical protein